MKLVGGKFTAIFFYMYVFVEVGDFCTPVIRGAVGCDGQTLTMQTDTAVDLSGFVVAVHINIVAGKGDIVLHDSDVSLSPDLERGDINLRIIGCDDAGIGLDADMPLENIAAGVNIQIIRIGGNGWLGSQGHCACKNQQRRCEAQGKYFLYFHRLNSFVHKIATVVATFIITNRAVKKKYCEQGR